MRRLLSFALAVSLAGCGGPSPAKKGLLPDPSEVVYEEGEMVYLDHGSDDVLVWLEEPKGEPGDTPSRRFPSGVRGMCLGQKDGLTRIKLDDGPLVWAASLSVKRLPK